MYLCFQIEDFLLYIVHLLEGLRIRYQIHHLVLPGHEFAFAHLCLRAEFVFDEELEYTLRLFDFLILQELLIDILCLLALAFLCKFDALLRNLVAILLHYLEVLLQQ